MSYRVIFSKNVNKTLSKMDKKISIMLTKWLRNNLENCENPRLFGRELKGNFEGKWRYRVGDYRIIADIHDKIVTIVILEIGHRKNIYKKV